MRGTGDDGSARQPRALQKEQKPDRRRSQGSEQFGAGPVAGQNQRNRHRVGHRQREFLRAGACEHDFTAAWKILAAVNAPTRFYCEPGSPFFAKAASFSEAGRRLDLRQSTVSQHIRRLEQATWRRLFVCDTRNVTLPADGQAMVALAPWHSRSQRAR